MDILFATECEYLYTIESLSGDRFGMIEFVQGNSPDQFIDDARTIKKLYH